MQYIAVYLTSQSKSKRQRYTALTNQNGEFIFRNINAGIYLATVIYPGYFQPDSIDPTSERTKYVPNDNANIQLIKGGVITGKISDQDGQPLMNIPVIAIRLRDSEGHPIVSAESQIVRITDDRGIYRFYGLRPGSYIVRTSGRVSGRVVNINPNINDAYVYYPFGSRETAKEILVSAGSETSGIDINYRSEPGHSLSGLVANLNPESIHTVSVYVGSVTKGNIEDSITFQVSSNESGFGIYGLQDGDYEVMAVYRSADDRTTFSNTVRATIKAKDVGGLKLSPNPTGLIKGRVVLDSSPPESLSEQCQKPSFPPLDEISIGARGRQRATSKLESMFESDIQTTLSDKGEFLLNNLPLTGYDLEPWLPGSNLYVSFVGAADAKPATNKPPVTKVQPTPLRNLIEVRDATTIDGLVIKIRSGAASLTGSIYKDESDTKISDPSIVYLVPVENESANDIWRYYGVKPDYNSKFSINNVMPGRYWIIAIPAGMSGDNSIPINHLFWESAVRAKIRQQAQEKGKEIELRPCQRITDVFVVPSGSN